MDFPDLFDAYDRKARLAPTAVVFSPVLLGAYCLVPDVFQSITKTAITTGLWIALVYACSMFVRDLGLRCQDKLWASWGGPPSTRFARHRDDFLNDQQKTRLHAAIRRRFGLTLFGPGEEMRNPREADAQIAAAFKQVKEHLRDRPEAALLDKHNAEYGFARNLYGSRHVFLTLAMLAAVACWAFGSWRGAVANAGLCAMSLLIGWIVLPPMLKRSADTYAERAWLTFMKIEAE